MIVYINSLDLYVNGSLLAAGNVCKATVRQDLGQPDMADILANTGTLKFGFGDDLEIRVGQGSGTTGGGSKLTIFKGKLASVGFESKKDDTVNDRRLLAFDMLRTRVGAPKPTPLNMVHFLDEGNGVASNAFQYFIRLSRALHSPPSSKDISRVIDQILDVASAILNALPGGGAANSAEFEKELTGMLRRSRRADEDFEAPATCLFPQGAARAVPKETF